VFLYLFFVCLVAVAPSVSAFAALPVHGVAAGVSNSVADTYANEVEAQSVVGEPKPGFFRKRSIANLQVVLEEFIQVLYWRFDVLITANSAKVPYDISRAMDRISQGNGISGFFRMFRILTVVFALALGVEFVFRWIVLSRFRVAIPEDDILHIPQRLWPAPVEEHSGIYCFGLVCGGVIFFLRADLHRVFFRHLSPVSCIARNNNSCPDYLDFFCNNIFIWG